MVKEGGEEIRERKSDRDTVREEQKSETHDAEGMKRRKGIGGGRNTIRVEREPDEGRGRKGYTLLGCKRRKEDGSK